MGPAAIRGEIANWINHHQGVELTEAAVYGNRDRSSISMMVTGVRGHEGGLRTGLRHGLDFPSKGEYSVHL